MSSHSSSASLYNKDKITVPALKQRKGKDPIVCLTAYTTPMARLLDPHVDLLLVGDSLGMVQYGYPSTLAVDVDTMIRHGAAVTRGAKRACVIVDMPFGSYQESREQAFRNAARIMAETGCDGVKIEGGAVMAETVRFLAERGVPVMGHIGLMPQSVQTLGGYRAQGTDQIGVDQLKHDILAVADAGAFSVVIEATVESVARELTAICPIPTIGIGASPACDGQVLVIDDMLGLTGDGTPRFVKKFADLAGTIDRAAAQYAAEVKTRSFPSTEHCFGTKPKSKSADQKK